MAHFKLNSEWLVSNIKDLVLNGNWQDAINQLKESYDLNYDDVINVIKGNKNIINNELVDQIDESYKNEVYDIYLSEVFIHSNQMFKFVDTLTLDELSQKCFDYGFLIDRKIGTPMKLRNNEGRSYYLRKIYDEDNYIFETIELGSSKLRYVVMEKAKNIPFWFAKDDVKFQNIKDYLNSNLEISEIEQYNEGNTVLNDINQKEILTEEKRNKNHSLLQKSNASIRYDNMIGLCKNIFCGNEKLENIQKQLRKKIIKQYNDNNFEWRNITIEVNDKTMEVNVPVEIVLSYLHSSFIHESNNYKNKWKTISPKGLKMENDSPSHTDLWLALGFPLDNTIYLNNHINNQILYEVIFKIRHNYLKKNNITKEFDVISDVKLKSFSGRIVFEDCSDINDSDILVIPNANLKYEKIARKAGMVIFEQGGKMSHLFIINKNDNLMLPMIRMEKAIEKLKQYQNQKVFLDFEKCTITPESIELKPKKKGIKI